MKFRNKIYPAFLFPFSIHCGYSLEPPRRGVSNEYPQFMFLAKLKKNNVYLCKPQFYYIKVGFNGVKIILMCFRDAKYSDTNSLSHLC